MKNSDTKLRGAVSLRLISIPLLLCGLLVAFNLFEPIFVYNYGWRELPNNKSAPIIIELKDRERSLQSTAAAKALNQFYSDTDTASVSLAVASEGELIWRGAVGYADLENKRVISFDDQFRIGSTAKAITSVAIGALLTDGHLSLNTTMGSLDPSLDKRLHPITLKQAMSHRAGIRNYGMCFCFPVWEHLNNKSFSSIRDSIRVIESSPLLHKPDTGFQYTSLGYNLVGLAAESAAKKTFEDILNEDVFLPLNMNNSRLERKKDSLANFAKPYEIEKGRFKLAFNVDNSIRWPSGGMLSTPTDMVYLGNAMLDDRLLSDSVRKSILTIPDPARINGGASYALGWRVSNWKLDAENSEISYHHNGVAVGSKSVFVIFPETRLVVSAMTNKAGTNVNELAKIVNSIALIFMSANKN